jgi:lipoate-protein ligase B
MKDAFSVSSAERGAQVATTKHCLGQRSIYHLSMMRRGELFVSPKCIVTVRPFALRFDFLDGTDW